MLLMKIAGSACTAGVTVNAATELDFEAADLGVAGDFLNATNSDPAVEVTVVVEVV
jgi:hypothetical protein